MASPSSESSSLSSVPSDIILPHERLQRARERLAEYEQLKDHDTKAVKVLRAFISELPHDGTQVLCEDILSTADAAELRQLGTHLLEAVLVKCRYSLLEFDRVLVLMPARFVFLQ